MGSLGRDRKTPEAARPYVNRTEARYRREERPNDGAKCVFDSEAPGAGKEALSG
jgi:hypothetical protein